MIRDNCGMMIAAALTVAVFAVLPYTMGLW